jgi:hypothetical protein
MKKLGIIVPYRNRETHLKKFKQHVIHYLNKNGYTDYSVIVVEQDNAKLFNRGMLCNIGFLEAEKQKCDYIVIHDVDMLPLDIDYTYSPHPIHLATDNLPFESYFGGITLFPSETFKKINGFSNVYWGWGFEDDDLRYRCIKNDIPFKTKNIEKDIDYNVAIFNGNNSYAKIPNIINYNRSFTIELNINFDRVFYDKEKQYDIFPILSIKGWDFKIYYNSFNRFYIQFFDRKGNYYDIHSDIITSFNNNIIFNYDRTNKEIQFILNNKEQGVVKLDYFLHNYSKEEFILFGTDIEKENYFKGSLNSFKIIQDNTTKVEYNTKNNETYELKDLSLNDNHGNLYKVYFDKFKTPINYYSYIPYRRDSKILKLDHKDCGFNGGRWVDDNSRWNQLRYNNEVQIGHHDDVEDGLSNCKGSYIIYGKTKENNYVHLNVGI